MPSRIEDYALIGDCETAALVSRKGSIDWLCWPHFASAACFAALLGSPEEGHWSITAKGDVKISRRYLDHTLVLETKFETAEGAAILSWTSCRLAVTTPTLCGSSAEFEA